MSARMVLGLAALAGPLALAIVWHVSVGARTVPLAEVWRALVAPDPSLFDHAVVRELRLPRAVASATVGAALAVAGAVLQAVTRNPLAEPATLSLMSGASSSVVLGIGWFSIAGSGWIPVFAAAGSVAAAGMVWGLASAIPGGARPLSMILAGAAVTVFLGAINGIVILLDEETFRSLRGWMVGSLAGVDMSGLRHGLPWIGAGMVLALGLARSLTTLAMGDEVAQGLGVPVARIRTLALLASVALTSASVSMAGLMGFVGLVIPHAVRLFAGADYARILPLSAVLGAAYLTVVDTISRIVLAPVEISTGVMTAILGAPVFLWLVRRRAG